MGGFLDYDVQSEMFQIRHESTQRAVHVMSYSSFSL